MANGSPVVLKFSDWDGTPFFKGQPEQGRHVYIVKKDEGAFDGYGFIDPDTYVFLVHGANKDELKGFIDEVKVEGAKVTHGAPPLETKTGGETPPPSGGTPSGYKGTKQAVQ